jgi:hypothetical protein
MQDMKMNESKDLSSVKCLATVDQWCASHYKWHTLGKNVVQYKAGIGEKKNGFAYLPVSMVQESIMFTARVTPAPGFTPKRSRSEITCTEGNTVMI